MNQQLNDKTPDLISLKTRPRYDLRLNKEYLLDPPPPKKKRTKKDEHRRSGIRLGCDSSVELSASQP